MRRDTPEFERFEDELGVEAEGEGWGLYLTDGGERLELLASDQNRIFSDDVDAWAFIVRRASMDLWSAAAAALLLISDDYRDHICRTVRRVFS
jgi:hypothetical protein